MRRRLVAAFVSLVVLVVAAYGIPRALIRVEQVQDRVQEQVDQTAVLVAGLVAAQEDAGQPVTRQGLAAGLRPGEHVAYVGPDGAAVEAGSASAGAGDISATEQVAGGGTVTVTFADDALDERIRDAVLPLLLIGLVLVPLSWVVAHFLARRLARPFQELAAHARALGSGRFDLDVPHYDIPEAEQVGEALRTSARSLDGLVRHERELAVHASHELRTPLTAARLRLEDLSLWPETTPEVAGELGEVLAELTRLETAVATLLERERTERGAVTDEVDLTALVTSAAERWRPVLDRRQRGLDLDLAPDLLARVPAAEVTEVVDALLGHLVQHGQGRVVVAGGRNDGYLELAVGDESPRAGSDPLRDRTGASGLPAAVDLAAAAGGHLALSPADRTTLLLRLPVSSS